MYTNPHEIELPNYHDVMQSWLPWELTNYEERWEHIRTLGFVRLSKESLKALSAFLEGGYTLEVGSGTGFLAARLEAEGCKIKTVDKRDPQFHHPMCFNHIYKLDYNCDAVSLLPGEYTHILMCWPNLREPFAYEVAKAMRPGQILVYEGEGFDGCTADKDFFTYIDGPEWVPDIIAAKKLNEHHLQFGGIHDDWSVYIKAGQ